jgi:hypothetical protein
MRRIAAAALLATVALVFLAAPSSAAMRWGAEVFGGFNTHSMSDWNDAIDEANSFGANFDNINDGFSFGVGPTVVVNENWMFGAHYERLMPGSSEDSGIEIKPSANAFGVTGTYLFPSSGPMSFGIGAGVDYITLGGTLSDPTTELDEEGSGVGFQFYGTTSHAFSPVMSGAFTVGYRLADIDVDNIGGEDPSTIPLSSEDYSGLMLRVGLNFSAPNK